MFKTPKQEYTAKFKELAVKRVKAGQGIDQTRAPFQNTSIIELETHVMSMKSRRWRDGAKYSQHQTHLEYQPRTTRKQE